jgi:hypothetical protein
MTLFQSNFLNMHLFGLSLAEVRHAKLLKKLKEAAYIDQISFDEGNLTKTTLNAYLIRLDDLLQKAKKGSLLCRLPLVAQLIMNHPWWKKRSSLSLIRPIRNLKKC